MRLHVDDDSFVRAPAGLVYRRLTHIQAWPEWWPGLAVRPVLGPENSWTLEFERKQGRLRLHAIAGSWRHDRGFVLRVSGDLEGTFEFWLEGDDPGARLSGQGQPLLDGGTVIHVVTSAETVGRRPLRTAKRLRRSIRAGMWGFKDRIQGEVRDMIGLEQ